MESDLRVGRRNNKERRVLQPKEEIEGLSRIERGSVCERRGGAGPGCYCLL